MAASAVFLPLMRGAGTDRSYTVIAACQTTGLAYLVDVNSAPILGPLLPAGSAKSKSTHYSSSFFP